MRPDKITKKVNVKREETKDSTPGCFNAEKLFCFIGTHGSYAVSQGH